MFTIYYMAPFLDNDVGTSAPSAIPRWRLLLLYAFGELTVLRLLDAELLQPPPQQGRRQGSHRLAEPPHVSTFWRLQRAHAPLRERQPALSPPRPRRTNAQPTAIERADDRARDVDPVAGEVAADERRAERARRIHRRTADRARPEARERDVAADAEGGDRADVLRGGGGAEDDADEPTRQRRSPSAAPASSLIAGPGRSRRGARRSRTPRRGRGRRASPRSAGR